MKYTKYCEIKNIVMHKTRETHIYMVHLIQAMSIEKQTVLPFILSNKIKR